MTDDQMSFDERIAARLGELSTAEQRVARMFQANREEVLFASAAALAAKAGTSDATIVRTTKRLGFSGMEELRRSLAAEMKESLSPAGRVAATLRGVGDDVGAAFDATLAIHQESLDRLRRDVSLERFQTAVDLLTKAERIVVFGIGPSSAMANYFAMQLGRFGLDAVGLTRTGILFADDLQRLRSGDLLMILAYGRVYREVSVLLRRAQALKLTRILMSDTLGGSLREQVDLELPVARGRAEMFSMHTATLGLIEALLVGLAAKRPTQTLKSLDSLDELRREMAGNAINLRNSRRRGN